MYYGRPGRFFTQDKDSFSRSVWIELIGFDMDAEDLGVEAYLQTLGFVPDMISLLLTSVDFVNTHRGMETEYVLPPYACSYCGHTQNDLRHRQDWTNYRLRALIRTLQEKGIKVYISFFDFNPRSAVKFRDSHPEITDDGGGSILMIKRFTDGSRYEDFLARKLLETVRDYGFDGVQLADGISSPRSTIWEADFSDDLMEQSRMEVPEGTDRRQWIPTEKREEWLWFFCDRWSEFLTKTIRTLKDNGIEVAVNSAWARDPLEAMYRYGTDYAVMDEAGADRFVVEDVSSDLAILSDEENTYDLTYEDRKRIHYEFVANLMAISAHTAHMKITPLFMIWDQMEQWSVIRHAPTAMQRAAAGNFSHFCMKNGRWRPITDGPHFCLGDALTKEDWGFIRLCLDNGYTPDAVRPDGAVFLWSCGRVQKELEALVKHGSCHSARYLALLLRKGAAIGGIANIADLDRISGDIVVSNFSLLPEEEQEKIAKYDRGRVIRVGMTPSRDVSRMKNPVGGGWPKPLEFEPVPDEYLSAAVEEIDRGRNARLVFRGNACTITEVWTGTDSSVIFIDNNEYFYTLPEIETKRRIRSVRFITKPDGYPVKYKDHWFKVRVPGRGVDIAELVYEPEMRG